MGDARRAVPSDADEMVRLRGLMLAGMRVIGVSNVSTDPAYRWRGHGRACLTALPAGRCA